MRLRLLQAVATGRREADEPAATHLQRKANRESDNCSLNGEQGIRQSRSVCGKKAESDWRGRQTTETRIIRISETNKTEPETLMALAEAGRIIREGGLVAFPTETVYGLGGDAMNPESSKKIYAANRPTIP